MEIVQCKTESQFEEMMGLAKNHPEPEYDCDFNTFYHVCKRLFVTTRFRAWIAYDGKKPIGYVSGFRELVLRNEVRVFDIYLDEEHWGIGGLTQLTDKIKEWAKKDNAKRVTWTSQVSARAWSRITGLEVSEYRTLIWGVE